MCDGSITLALSPTVDDGGCPTCFAVYSICIPIVCFVGIIGNALSFAVLSRRTKKFRGIMFVFLRTLALFDSMYLVFTLVVCFYVPMEGIESALPKASMSRGAQNFTFNVLPPILNSFGTASDLVIVFLTMNRFWIVKNATKVQRAAVAAFSVTGTKGAWLIRIEMLATLMFSLFCQIPYFYRYDVIRCCDCEIANATISSHDADCFTHECSPMTEEVWWTVYDVVHKSLTRVLPTIIICTVNWWMYSRLIKIKRARGLTFGSRRRRGNGGGAVIEINEVPTVSSTVKVRRLSSTRDQFNFTSQDGESENIGGVRRFGKTWRRKKMARIAKYGA